ncbi:MAG: hypothetical protein JWN70_4514 [Planctomycetaceae bacterium]|nr:hypothetical protein [Planctomycetaceae bacterium]
MSTEIVIDLTTPTEQRQPVPSIFREPFIAVLLGIILPLACLACDPIIFSRGVTQPILGPYRMLCYKYIAISMLSLIAWLISRQWPSLFTGLLLGGCVFAMLLGMVILPISFVGLMVFIGIFGFSPFLTAATFWHCAMHARERAGSGFRRGVAVTAFSLFLAVPPSTQAAVCYLTDNLLTEMTTGSDQTAEQAIGRLKLLEPLLDTDQLVWQYRRTESVLAREQLAQAHRLQLLGPLLDKDQLLWGQRRTGSVLARERLAHAYKALTGKNIELRMYD